MILTSRLATPTPASPFFIPNPDRWADDAACIGLPLESFFPDPSDRETEVVARAVCDSCPVRTPCAQFALANPEIEGVWGGTTTETRKYIRSGRRVPKDRKIPIRGRMNIDHLSRLKTVQDALAAGRAGEWIAVEVGLHSKHALTRWLRQYGQSQLAEEVRDA